ncbi:MAG: hypothetical protein U9O94_03735 [Nanoarchaeota archaeon]|nr:hypothetical protein [Nanoarchaeota archaeon]
MPNKKAEMPFFNIKIIIAVLFLALILVAIWPKLGVAKDTFFDLLGIGEEKCTETGTTYSEQSNDLKNAASQGRYTNTKKTYESLKKCFPEKEKEFKKEMLDSFNSYIKESSIHDGLEFLNLLTFMKDILGKDSNKINTNNLKPKIKVAYTQSIDLLYGKIQTTKNEALDPAIEAYEIGPLKDNAKEDLKELQELCNQPIEYESIKQQIEQECNTKIEEAKKLIEEIEAKHQSKLFDPDTARVIPGLL